MFRAQVRNPPGKVFAYSDVGFIVLAELVREVSGQDVHAFSQEHALSPAGHEGDHLLYRPTELQAADRADRKRSENGFAAKYTIRGRSKLGGIAGHAGLFSTATDLATYTTAMLDRGRPILREGNLERNHRTATRFRRSKIRNKFRTFGWDMRSGYSGNRGSGMSAAAFGHGGFTGTGMWIDPERDLFVIFLANRLHPDGKGSVNPLIGRIGTIAVEALQP